MDTTRKPFDLHVLVCTNTRPEGQKKSCGPLGAEALRAELKDWLKSEVDARPELKGKVRARVNGSGCLILLADAQGPAERGRAAARAVVSRWFADADTDEAVLDTLIGTLQPGFKKILGVLGSGRLVLTDHPQARGSTLADSEAFVFSQRERLEVVYVEGAFFGSGNLLKGLKNWTRILVHELSHREQKTVDKFYAWQGIKPVVGGSPSVDAIVNAESWAFFCADAAGALTDGDPQSALQ